jgi:nitrite reductase/ring-hydroxylating ferredoxin subunit
MAWQRACAVDELTENAMRTFWVSGTDVLIVRGRDRFYAFPPLCPHEEAELEFGACDGERLICMQHLWQWDLEPGAPAGPAEVALTPYPTRVEGGEVQVLIDD